MESQTLLSNQPQRLIDITQKIKWKELSITQCKDALECLRAKQIRLGKAQDLLVEFLPDPTVRQNICNVIEAADFTTSTTLSTINEEFQRISSEQSPAFNQFVDDIATKIMADQIKEKFGILQVSDNPELQNDKEVVNYFIEQANNLRAFFASLQAQKLNKKLNALDFSLPENSALMPLRELDPSLELALKQEIIILSGSNVYCYVKFIAIFKSLKEDFFETPNNDFAKAYPKFAHLQPIYIAMSNLPFCYFEPIASSLKTQLMAIRELKSEEIGDNVDTLASKISELEAKIILYQVELTELTNSRTEIENSISTRLLKVFLNFLPRSRGLNY
jgi:hypothetical protein